MPIIAVRKPYKSVAFGGGLPVVYNTGTTVTSDERTAIADAVLALPAGQYRGLEIVDVDVDGDETVISDYATKAYVMAAIDGVDEVLYRNLARSPDTIIAGAVTRDSNGAATSATVVWPDNTVGTYTADTVSTAFPGAVDAYHITYGSPATKTYTQPAITRDATTGAATIVPAIVVS